MHTLQPVNRLQPDPVVAHRQVAAFDERKAEIARQQRMLEVGFVVRPRGEQDDVRRAVAARRPAQQRRAQCLEVRGEVLHRQLAEHLREDARNDEPVLERVARTRRRLRAVAHHPPASVGRARQVGRVLQQVHAAHRLQALRRAEKAAVAEDHGRRNGAALQQRLRAVDVAEDAVEQVGALGDAGLDRIPFVGRQEQRQRVDFPRAVGSHGVVVDVVGDALLADLPLGQRQRLAHLALAALGERTHEGVPVRPRLRRAGQQLVVAVALRRVAGEQLRQHRPRGADVPSGNSEPSQ